MLESDGNTELAILITVILHNHHIDDGPTAWSHGPIAIILMYST